MPWCAGIFRFTSGILQQVKAFSFCMHSFESGGAFAGCLTIKLGYSQGFVELRFHVVSQNLWSSFEVVLLSSESLSKVVLSS